LSTARIIRQTAAMKDLTRLMHNCDPVRRPVRNLEFALSDDRGNLPLSAA
jgi:hypothetical protein